MCMEERQLVLEAEEMSLNTSSLASWSQKGVSIYFIWL